MDSLPRHRITHWTALIFVWAVMSLPYLGAPTLWDNDEGLNAEAAREMYDSGNWIVPRFNFQLRDAKPALLYWLQAGAFHAFGVNEFAARLPSALATLLAVLAIYELGRSMFSPGAGLLAGIALMSSILVCALAHFANPDALLLACTSLSFLAFWRGFAPASPGAPPGRGWFIPFGAACGLGVLAKGPVAVVLPTLVVLIWLAWQRQLRCLWDRRILWMFAAYAVVAFPWYTLVIVETRGAYFRGFILKNNVGRYLAPMGDHRGPFYYHGLVLLAGFAPWSAFLLPTLWHALRSCRRRPAAEFRPEGERPLMAARLLVAWFFVYLLFFTGAATKLPGYALPLYPAIALLTAKFLRDWARGDLKLSGLVIGQGYFWLALIGVGTTVTLSMASGTWANVNLPFRPVPELRSWAWLGAIPVVGAIVGMLLLVWNRRRPALAAFAASSIALLAIALGPALTAFNGSKSSRELLATAGADRRDRDSRLGCYLHPQPSLVFYGQREVQLLAAEEDVARFLAAPTPAYLIVPRPAWEESRARWNGIEVASRWDLYRNCEVVVVTNVR